MCLNPIKIRKKGRYLEDNYRGAQGDYYDITTYSKCGYCMQCINEKCNNWVQRNYYEQFDHEEKCFITLTYKVNPYIIVRKDLQDFMKRLRRYLTYRYGKDFKIRMFGNMEYGELNGRPHAHVIIYGWKDKFPVYKGLNKKKNIIMESKIITKLWGLGRTCYQEFSEYEIPYITLYSTPQEIFKKAYKMTREKLKKIREKAIIMEKSNDIPLRQYKNLMAELMEIENEMNEEKAKYYAIKEFNTWSIALGWRKFEEEYYNSNNFVFQTYIQEKEFCTPSPWVKKLANAGNIHATNEMFRREKMIVQTKNEQEERLKNENLMITKRRKEREEWSEQKDKIEEL